MRKFRDMIAHRVDTPKSRLASVLYTEFVDHAVLRHLWTNEARIGEGVTRANHPTWARLKRFKKRGGKTVVSLRGAMHMAQNVLEARAAGAEVHAEMQRRLASGATLRAEAAYTYTDVRLGGTQPGAVYKYALGHAPHLVQARVLLQAGALRLGVDGLWKNRLDLPTVAVADAELGLAAPVSPARGELTLAFRNLTDAQYAEVFGAPMPGRSVHGGVRLAF